MFHRRRTFLRLRLALADMAVTAIAFELAYVLRQQLPALRLFYLDGPTMAALLLSVLAIWQAAGSAAGLYRSPDALNAGRVVRGVLRQTAWSTAVLMGVLYLAKLSDVSRLFMLLFVVLNAALLMGWRLAAPALRRAATGAAPKKHYVIVGSGDDAVEVARLIEEGGEARVLAFVADDPAGNADVLERCWQPGTFTEKLKEHVVDEVIFAVDRQRAEKLSNLFEACEAEGVTVRVVVNFFPGMASGVSLDRLHHLPLLTFNTTPDNDYLLFLKRLFDISVAASMAAVFAPVSVLVIAAIRLSSRGPVFFRQTRCGLNGRPFQLYKFRSMYEDAPGRRAEIERLNEMDGPVFKCANDPRITPVGRYLRKFSIDEWPQLVNVLKGDMSLVGPRPPLPEEVAQYKPWQRRRLRMRPGLTCLWVLEGRNRLDFLQWMRLDLHYIDHWSLTLDCKILLQSIPHVLSGKGM